MDVSEGETVTYERTFTERDVRNFAAVSKDRGEHHLEPDDEGRLLVHGLLTATLPTKIGGDHDVLARTMTFEFRRPVYAGETVRCAVTFTTVDPGEDRVAVAADVECTRDGEPVLSGSFDGVVLRDAE